jgi:hypothetical protein
MHRQDIKEFVTRKSVIELMDRFMVGTDRGRSSDPNGSIAPRADNAVKYVDALAKYYRGKTEIFLEMCEFFGLQLRLSTK